MCARVRKKRGRDGDRADIAVAHESAESILGAEVCV